MAGTQATRKTWHRWLALTVLGACTALLVLLFNSSTTEQAIVLLVPDAEAKDLPVTQAWVDAAREEGIRMVVRTDDEFMRHTSRTNSVSGVILPDTVHRRASGLLIDMLQGYASGGGRVFVAFDAGVLDATTDSYASDRSRLSRLVGVDYALYGTQRDDTITTGAVYGSHESARLLGIQPGKLDFKFAAYPDLGELSTYGYPRLIHSFFRTKRTDGARVLLNSFEGDAVVTQHAVGEGSVLFANLALGYLKTRTDGYLLHTLLRHFAVNMLQQPHLSPVPNGQGGLVLNLHIDSNAAQKPLLALEAIGWFDAGPFSLHVTAGPDTSKLGDRMGLDIDNNPEMQGFLRRMAAAGHEVGSHGGWNHNIFGFGANDENEAQFRPYLEYNHKTMSKALGTPVKSYSAPMGNQPVWVTHWLAEQGLKAYYFTGDAGLGPTRSYFEGKRPDAKVWAFPVTHFRTVATLEELDQTEADQQSTPFTKFLESLTDFVATERMARLIYFHPPAMTSFEPAVKTLIESSSGHQAKGRFRWYTMERLADFLTLRDEAEWTVTGQPGRAQRLLATTPKTLKELTWVVPTASVRNVVVLQGVAQVRKQGADWLVTAGDCQTLELELQ
jgi:peptidoglycan/xylan/chitin deacetylase (PgdA/CDA1 family)